jgi:hypothetical protein
MTSGFGKPYPEGIGSSRLYGFDHTSTYVLRKRCLLHGILSGISRNELLLKEVSKFSKFDYSNYRRNRNFRILRLKISYSLKGRIGHLFGQLSRRSLNKLLVLIGHLFNLKRLKDTKGVGLREALRWTNQPRNPQDSRKVKNPSKQVVSTYQVPWRAPKEPVPEFAPFHEGRAMGRDGVPLNARIDEIPWFSKPWVYTKCHSKASGLFVLPKNKASLETGPYDRPWRFGYVLSTKTTTFQAFGRWRLAIGDKVSVADDFSPYDTGVIVFLKEERPRRGYCSCPVSETRPSLAEHLSQEKFLALLARMRENEVKPPPPRPKCDICLGPMAPDGSECMRCGDTARPW